MEIIKEKLIPLKENEQGFNNIKVVLYYRKEDKSYRQPEGGLRGYYVEVAPVEVENKGFYTTTRTESHTGFYCQINHVARKSKKAAAEAEETMKNCLKGLIDRVALQNGVTLV